MVIYNTLSKVKEPFVPLQNRKISIYVCGITPYDTTHLGHAFLYTFFDVVVRFFTYHGYKVTYTQNVTDIDDDILKRAKEEGKDWKALGQFWTNRFLQDLQDLHVLPPTHYIKATDSIEKIIDITKTLIEKKHAYEKSGNVFFSITSFPNYGQLSTFSKEQMQLIAKERGGDPDDPLKNNPLDFVLWKKSEKNEPSWESPWGNGRPGWHIECSAMIAKTLGEQIDIHGGGRDLVFPHHESEIAQSESASGKTPFVKYWMHVAMVMYKGEKMSKSLKNLVLVSDLLKKFSPNAIRYVLLFHHYRIPWEFEESELITAEKNVLQMKEAVGMQKGHGVCSQNNIYCKEFTQAMQHDFNTPQALSVLLRLCRKVIAEQDAQAVKYLQQTLAAHLCTLGFVF